MRWSEFEQACPELAADARARLEKDQLILLGTLQRDGPKQSRADLALPALCASESPRVSWSNSMMR